jgi:hypothetical protein
VSYNLVPKLPQFYNLQAWLSVHLEYCAASLGDWLPTFRHGIGIPEYAQKSPIDARK